MIRSVYDICMICVPIESAPSDADNMNKNYIISSEKIYIWIETPFKIRRNRIHLKCQVSFAYMLALVSKYTTTEAYGLPCTLHSLLSEKISAVVLFTTQYQQGERVSWRRSAWFVSYINREKHTCWYGYPTKGEAKVLIASTGWISFKKVGGRLNMFKQSSNNMPWFWTRNAYYIFCKRRYFVKYVVIQSSCMSA